MQDSAPKPCPPEKPVPMRTADNAPFIDGLREGRVMLQRCAGCERLRYPAARHCPHCLSDAADWVAVSGRGHVYSFTIVHQVYQAAFEADVPYNVVIVQLDEGPRIISNLVACSNDDIRIGMSVEAEFSELSDERTLLKFRPLTAP
jgi:uncharacterized OB-fold protein